MKKQFLILSICVATFACKQGKVESTKSVATMDSARVDSAVVVKDTLASLPELTGQAKILGKKWKATEVELPSGKLPGEIIDLQFDFRKDYSFEYSEDGKKDKGTWKLSEDGKNLDLTYESKATSKLAVKELNDRKLILSGKEHGLARTYTMAPLK